MPIFGIPAIIAILKAMGLKAIAVKLGLLLKGGTTLITLKPLALKMAFNALQIAQTQGAIVAATAVVNMLLIIGTLSATSLAVKYAWEALEAFSKGDFFKGSKLADKATSEANIAKPGFEFF